MYTHNRLVYPCRCENYLLIGWFKIVTKILAMIHAAAFQPAAFSLVLFASAGSHRRETSGCLKHI